MRKTVADLTNGLYAQREHKTLSDRGSRRYHPFSFDFDSTPRHLKDPEEHWDEDVKRRHLRTRAQLVDRLSAEYGTAAIDQVIENVAELGPKSMSLVAYHNAFNEQIRHSFVSGSYYPALVAACALGERILNHLVLDLRDGFRTSPHYKKVYRKESFDDWSFAVKILTDWKVLADGVAVEFEKLNKLRNDSVHFNQETYRLLRSDALLAVQRIDLILAAQFGYLGSQPWFIENTPGAQFVKECYESHAFVRKYVIPVSGFVGPLYGMEMIQDGTWRHLDYADYGDIKLSDEEFAEQYRSRDSKLVVSRKLIERHRKKSE